MKWFRFHHDQLNNAKVQALPGPLFKHWVNCMSVASANREDRGRLPAISRVAFALHVSVKSAEKIVETLKDLSLIDPDGMMHDWHIWNPPSDDSAPRARRARSGSNETDLELDSESIQTDFKVTSENAETLSEQNQQDSAKCNGAVTAPDIEEEEDIETDKRNPSTRGKEKRRRAPTTPALFDHQPEHTDEELQRYGDEFQAVQLTASQHAKLTTRLGKYLPIYIDRLDRYSRTKPKKFREYQSHYLVLINWYEGDYDSDTLPRLTGDDTYGRPQQDGAGIRSQAPGTTSYERRTTFGKPTYRPKQR